MNSVTLNLFLTLLAAPLSTASFWEGFHLQQQQQHSSLRTPAPTPSPSIGSTTDQFDDQYSYQDTRCDYNWTALQSEFSVRRATWNSFKNSSTSPGCYNMTYERYCFCGPEWRGPYNVVVQENHVVSPLDYSIYTMDELFDLVDTDCVKGCPGPDGPAFCEIEYALESEGSYITSIFIDKSYLVADEEVRLSVANLTTCE